MNRLAVVGAGAWGTALALQAARAGQRVVLVARATSAAAIAPGRESPRLPGYRLPDVVEVSHAIPPDADLLFWVVPTQHLRSSLLRLRPAPGAMIVCAKGVEA